MDQSTILFAVLSLLSKFFLEKREKNKKKIVQKMSIVIHQITTYIKM